MKNRNLKNRIAAILLATLMVLGIVPAQAFAEGSDSAGAPGLENSQVIIEAPASPEDPAELAPLDIPDVAQAAAREVLVETELATIHADIVDEDGNVISAAAARQASEAAEESAAPAQDAAEELQDPVVPMASAPAMLKAKGNNGNGNGNNKDNGNGSSSSILWANDDIYLTGKMPKNGIVEATPVTTEIDGRTVIAAYDIKIYNNANQKAKGKTWQPAGEKVKVHIKSDALSGQTEDVDIYHIADGSSPEFVTTVAPKDGAVDFEAESFSVYVIVEHEGGEIVTPRVEFHYIDPDYNEIINSVDDGHGGTTTKVTYKAPGYEFLNQNNEYQITQILKNGEGLEQIINPPNKKDDLGNEASFFYGWYTVDMEENTTEYNAEATAYPYYTGTISYTWPNPQKVVDRTAITITDDGSPAAGEDITWTIGSTTGTAKLNADGVAHVYLVPVYEDYYFINFHMGNKESDAGLRNNLLTRRLVVFGQGTSAVTRIGDVKAPSPDPAHQIFAGWETVSFTNPLDPQTELYYETLDQEGNEKNVLYNGSETAQASGGYRITVSKSGSAMSSLDLYPVFAEARWVYFNTGASGNGAHYVGAQYRLTHDEGKGTAFASFPTTERPGYTFDGWHLSQTDGNGSGTKLTDGTGAFLPAVKGKTFYSHYTTTTTTDPNTGNAITTTTLTGIDNIAADGTKIFEITSDGKLYLYKDLDSLTVYASWTSKTVDYTVVYWLENANDDDYTLMYYKKLQGEAGAQTAAAETTTSDTYELDGVSHTPYTEYKLKFAHLAEDQDKIKAGDQAGIQQQTINGDGSTIVNVYYDRDVYTLRFDIGFAANVNGTWRYFISRITNSAQNGGYDGFLTTPDYTYDLGTTNPFDTSEYTGTKEVTGGIRYNNRNYDGLVYYYDITGKYGENILDKYPGTQSKKVNGSNQYLFVGWIPQQDSYYWYRVSSSIKGVFETISEDLILTGGNRNTGYVSGGRTDGDPDDYTAVTISDSEHNINTTSSEYGITQEFHCRYTTLGGSHKYLYRIYLADVDTLAYPSEPTDKFVITAGSGSNPKDQTPPTYYGYTLVDTKVLLSMTDTTGSTPGGSGSYSAYTIPELTAAGVGDGMIMVFRLQPNLHHISYKYGKGADDSRIGSEFGSTEEYYYGQSLANANIYNDTAIANTPVGHRFKGWYENQDGIGNPFDFNTTMPDGEIVLYAVYSPLSYRVIVNPNGAEIDHIDHTGNSYVGTYNGNPFNFTAFNRAATSERSADSGYNRSQATYINGTYGETIDEYVVSRSYVPIGDVAAGSYTGRLYYYLNFQYNSSDGSGLPSDLRNALYIDVTPSTPGGPINEAELRALYDFFYVDANTNFSLAPGSFSGMTDQNLGYEAWKALYIDKQDDGTTPQLYRKCNSKEAWVFLGWFKDDENIPYNFNDPVEGPFTLTAHWRLDGGYTIRYTPEYWLDSTDGNRYLINGDMDAWIDPAAGSETLSYTDGAATKIYKQPTNLTKGGSAVTDNSVNFRGWRLVSVNTTVVNGNTVVTYTPLEDGVFYDPDDDFTIDVQFADSNNILHMQAVYEETTSSVRRPYTANLTLDANSGVLVDASGNELAADANLQWNGVGTVLMDESADQIVFGDVQSNAAVHLYKYATSDTDTGLTGGMNYFKHPEGYFLLGFDPQYNPDNIVWVDPQNDSVTGAAQPYVPNYAADSVIGVQRTDRKTLYAIWEPMVYLTFENKTGVGPVTFGLSSTSSEALTVINVADGMYNRYPIGDYSSISLAKGETMTLAFPNGAEKTINITGTNGLGVGKVLVWNTSVALDGSRTFSTDPKVDPDQTNDESSPNSSYSHTTAGEGSHTHSLASGEAFHTKGFGFSEDLIVNSKAVTVTFTSRNNDYALLLKDNYNGDGTGGGTQELDFGKDEVKPVAGVKQTRQLPTTSTRPGYTFVGWATTLEKAAAGNADYSDALPDGNPWTILDLDDTAGSGGFFDQNTYGDLMVEEDDILVRTLYGVWVERVDAVYVYKEVSQYGNTKHAFDFTVAMSGSYHVGSTDITLSSSTNGYSADKAISKVFRIRHDEYLRIKATCDNGTDAGHTAAFLNVDVKVYYPATDSNGYTTYVEDTSRSGVIRWEYAVTPASTNGFNNDIKIAVTETQAQYYDTKVRLTSESDDNVLTIGTQTFAKSALSTPQEVQTDIISWMNLDAGGNAVFVNTRQTRDYVVTKTVVSNSNAPKQFSYSASYKDTYIDLDGTSKEDTIDLGTFTVTSGTPGTPNTEALANIPVGAVLTVSEDEYDSYVTTVSVDGAGATESRSAVVTVENVATPGTIDYTNTLKSYPVRFIKVDQDGTPGVVAATFNLRNKTGGYALGTNLQAYDTAGSNSVFYLTGADNGNGGIYEPMYAGQTYTLSEIFTETGYIGLNGDVNIIVSGDDAAPFDISDPDVTATRNGTVWEFKVKNLEEKDIVIVKALNDPLYDQRSFKFTWSYQFDINSSGSIDPATETFSGTLTLNPVSGSTDSNVSHPLKVPVGAKELVITELHENSGSDNYAWVEEQYDTTVQLNSEAATSGYQYAVANVTDAATVTFTNTRKTVEITVHKKVFGTDNNFPFTVTLKNGNNAVTGYMLHDDTDDHYDLITNSEGKITFNLRANGEVKLIVPVGAKLTVVETLTGIENHYDTNAQDDDDGTNDSVDYNINAAERSYEISEVTADRTITFTNTEVYIAPTDVNAPVRPFIMMLSLGLALLLLIRTTDSNRRRREQE